MPKRIIKAPAKINIGLNVTSKREDGYHNIETIFYPFNLFDIISITLSDHLVFNTNSEQLKDEKDNLILKAVRILEEHTSQKILVNINLKKNIPIGAGLGGGSSDGAATLKGLNNLYKFNLTAEILSSLALKIGSDAPFFILNKPCIGTSRGEILEQIDLKIPYPILLVNPGIHISTKWAYENIKPAIKAKSLKDIIEGKFNVNYYKELIFNDFEPVVFSKFNALQEIKDSMYAHKAIFALMTGSGSSFFGIFPDLVSLGKAERFFRKQKYFTYMQTE